MDDRVEGLQELHAFVLARLEERIRIAEGAEDTPGVAFALASREFLLLLGHDILTRPWAHAELERFLLRSARRYRRHPDFHTRWARTIIDGD